MKRYYTGIGSRQTPLPIRTVMCELARALTYLAYTLRSGGAPGADTAFENGAGEFSQIFVPWPGFEGRSTTESEVVYDHVSNTALEIAAKFHPAWNRCSAGAKKLHARNCYQVLGPGLVSPSEFVLCWTLAGQGSGGTGQALRIAKAYDIPIFDLGDRQGLARFLKHTI